MGKQGALVRGALFAFMPAAPAGMRSESSPTEPGAGQGSLASRPRSSSTS